MNNYYGFETTDDVEYSKAGLPLGLHKAMAMTEEAHEKDGKVTGFKVNWEIVEGEHKGRSGLTWYLTAHDNKITANIARERVKRIADATGSPVSPSNPVKGRVCVIEVKPQKGSDEYTEIVRYHPESHSTQAPTELPA